MTTATNRGTTMKNTAQQISAMFNDNGQCWETISGKDFDAVCDDHRGSREWRDGWGTDTYRWLFDDGSCLIVSGAAWDFGYPDCFCCRGDTHNEECVADLPLAKK
jgi:hypothetical protein